MRNPKKPPQFMQQAVFLYTEFLVERITHQRKKTIETIPATGSTKRGGLGIWQDKIWISDDFNAPLDDFQEYLS